MSCRSSSGVLTPKILIFDWDDTIFPSTFVDRHEADHFSDFPANVQKLLNEIAKVAGKCLHEASKHGEVIIITNSDDGWVKYSCERYLPRLLPVIARYRVVSARTQYECFYPSQPLCWKAAAFAHEVNECFESYLPFPSDEDEDDWQDANASLTDVSSSSSSSASDNDSGSEASGGAKRRLSSSSWSSGAAPERTRREILSFGDSMEERTAVRIVAEQLSATPKSVTFLTSPSPTQIIGQLAMLTSNMPHVSAHPASLDLEITAEQAETCAASVLRGRGHHYHFHGDSNHSAVSSKVSPPPQHGAEAASGVALSVDCDAGAA